MTEILHLANSEDGLEVIVTEISKTRYMLKFRDTDADQTIATRFFTTKESAEDFANTLIGTKS